ncbi:hypothetical protein AB0F52_38555 [Amycolatopsis sp. NPDC024027]|uniref:hypothetical protein n=1 Tax=Amycolatopsis sp. NPDC024027 TaxID=3154327 RepID=UPI0033CC3E53
MTADQAISRTRCGYDEPVAHRVLGGELPLLIHIHMEERMMSFRRLLTFVLAAVLAILAPVSAAQAASAPAPGAPRAGFTAASYCPERGEQVKTSTDATVYLVGPDYYLYAIPGDVYFRLWDRWQPISINDHLFIDCYFDALLLANSHLAKTANDATVWIYDRDSGGYRGITGYAFDKYHFSWSKIRVQSSVEPKSPWLWDN